MGLVRRRNEKRTAQEEQEHESPRCTGAMRIPEPAGLWERGREEGRRGLHSRGTYK